jgi:hypothetical protein
LTHLSKAATVIESSLTGTTCLDYCSSGLQSIGITRTEQWHRSIHLRNIRIEEHSHPSPSCLLWRQPTGSIFQCEFITI